MCGRFIMSVFEGVEGIVREAPFGSQARRRHPLAPHSCPKDAAGPVPDMPPGRPEVL